MLLTTEKPEGFEATMNIVGIVILVDHEVLLLKRSKDKKHFPLTWNLPSGKVEVGEEVIDAAVRELYEEAGIHLTAADLTLSAQFYHYDDAQPGAGIIFNAFVARRDGKPPVILNEESEEYTWVHHGNLREVSPLMYGEQMIVSTAVATTL